MALSGTRDFNENANKIVSRALKKIGKLATGQTATGEQLSDGMDSLNEMVLSWQSKQIFLWTEEEITVNTVSGTVTIAIESSVLYIRRAFIRIGNNDHPVTLKTFDWFNSRSRKDIQGRPRFMSVDSQHVSNMLGYLVRVPDAVYDFHYMGIKKLQDFAASKDADFPVRWTRALVYGLAAELAADAGLPFQEIQYLEVKAEVLFNEARTGEREMTGPEFVEGAFPC